MFFVPIRKKFMGISGNMYITAVFFIGKKSRICHFMLRFYIL